MIVRATDIALGLFSAFLGGWLLLVLITKRADIVATGWERHVFVLMFLAIVASGLRLAARAMRS